jgi:hypothetical protein
VLDNWYKFLPTIAAKALGKLAAFLPTGVTQVIEVVSTIVSWVQFFLDRGPEVLKTLEDIANVFKLVLNGGEELIDAVAKQTTGLIVKGIPIIFDLVATALGFPEIPQSIRKVFQVVRMTAQKPAIDLLRWLFKPVLSILDWFLKKLGLQEEALTTEVATKAPEKKRDVRVWAVKSSTKEVKLKMSASAVKDVMTDIDGAPMEMQTHLKELYKRALEDAQELDRKKNQLQLKGDGTDKREQTKRAVDTGDQNTKVTDNDLPPLADALAQYEGASCSVTPGKGKSCFIRRTKATTTVGHKSVEELNAGKDKMV